MNDYCLICAQPLRQLLTWTTLLFPDEAAAVCKTCESKFRLIEGETCRICSRPFHGMDETYRTDELCLDCIQWKKEGEELLVYNRSVYMYNDWMKEIMTAFKFRGDHALVNAFKGQWNKAYKAHFNKRAIAVPVPVSRQRLYERGFNQAFALAELLGQPIYDLLGRRDHERQSQKTRTERLGKTPVFFLKNHCDLTGRDVLLIDDIYTTGATIRQAAKLLKEAGCQSVFSLTLARS